MNWIGYRVLDSLITYPDAWFLSRTAFPIQKDGRWIDTTHRQVAHATTRALGVSPVHGQPIRMRAAQARSATNGGRTHRFSGLQGCKHTRASRAPSTHPTRHVLPAQPHPAPPPAHTKRARTNRSGRATYSAQALGRLPWFAPCLRRSRRLRPRFDMSFSLGLLSRLKHFCTHWPKPPRHRPFAATKVTEKRAATPDSSARAARRDHALSQRS